jgi:magnesium-transporting ATPase (P-type)
VLLIGLTLGQSPFKVIHLLWANLVMDILGAIALGTEPPKQEIGSQTEDKNTQANRVSRSSKIILPSMWRTIFTQSIYQLLVIIIL